MISEQEKLIISRAANNALCFGLGLITECKKALKVNNISWRNEHEQYIFNNYVNK